MFRQCHGYPFDFAHAPVFLAGIATSDSVPIIDTEPFEVSNFGSRILPLLPDKATKSPDDPSLQGFEGVSCFDQAEVVPPSSQVHIQLFDNLFQAFTTVAVGQLPDPARLGVRR
jgi:hypothetical protein